MSENLSSIIKMLKRTNRLLEGADIHEILTKIEELSENDKTKAFFLGQLLRSRSNSLTTASATIQKLQTYIDTNELTDYYNRQDIPGSKSNWTDSLFAIVGLLLLFAGVFQIRNDIITVGVDSKYHLFQVNGGGSTIIFGLILLVIGGLRLRYFYRQTRLLQKIVTKNSN